MRSLNNVELIRSKWQKGEVCVGTNVSLADAAISELFGEVGFDIAWIDMEHSAMSLGDALNHIRACRAVGVAPFVRVPSQDPAVIKPFLELHPAAIIIPRITSVADAEQAVSSCRYPPRGTRGFGPSRGVLFGGRNLSDYLENVDQEILVIPQIEHIDAVNDIDAILEIPGIDSICPGPNDLSASMGLLGQMSHPDVKDALDRLLAACKAKGMPMGQSVGFDPDVIKYWMDSGISWICSGGDWHLLQPAAQAMHDTMREFAAKR